MVVSRVARRREGLVGNVNRGRNWGLGSVQIEDPRELEWVQGERKEGAGCEERKRSWEWPRC